MKTLVAVLLFCSTAYAIQAPYLISATALSDSSVQLTWRNNEIAVEEFYVQRKDSTAMKFVTIDSVSAYATFYIDTKNLQPQTLYSYQVLAYKDPLVSVPSNIQQATTKTGKLFNRPSLTVYLNCEISNSAQLRILDSSNCETGYRIYRDDGMTGSFNLIAQIVSSTPKEMKPFTWSDTTISLYKWYNYKVSVYKSDDSLFSAPCSTLTFREQTSEAIKITKISDFPISPSGWSAKAGDSIILMETPAPEGKYTVINVKDVKNPTFAGYVDSSTLLSYPVQTLIPAYLKYGVYNMAFSTKVAAFNGGILVSTNQFLYICRIDKNNQLVPVDSQKASGSFILLNDSTLSLDGAYEFEYFSLKGFSILPVSFSQNLISFDYTHYQSSVQGIYNNLLIVSVDSSVCDGYSHFGACTSVHYNHAISVYDITSNRLVTFPNEGIPTQAHNTGIYISPTKNINFRDDFFDASKDTATELFFADIRDSHGYQTALSNNAVYIDSSHKYFTLQNIICDTLNKTIFLFFQNEMSILSYQQAPPNSVKNQAPKQSTENKLTILSRPQSSEITITFPNYQHNADLSFYDLSGRMIDKMHGVTSNSVMWRPKTKSLNCFIVDVRSGDERYVSRIMVR